jgi:type III secretion system (T3SS) inner membrane Yop/CscD-like protein
MASDISAVLIVEEGVHQAARAVLARGRNHVGPSATNDIVISDFRGSGTSFTLEHRGRDIVLHADAPVEFAGRKSLAPGQSRRCVSGMRFTSGGIALRLEMAGTAPGSAVSSIRSRLKLYLAVPAILALSAMVWGAAASFTAPPAIVRLNDAPETTGSIPAMSREEALSSRQRQAAALESLRQHLAAVDLGSLVLTARPDGSIEARGPISREQQATWREVGHWFDTVAGRRVVLVDAVNVDADPHPLAIQAVWSGHNPYVIDGDGSKHFIGSTLPSGWTVAGINETHVLVKRGQQTLAVRF